MFKNKRITICILMLIICILPVLSGCISSGPDSETHDAAMSAQDKVTDRDTSPGTTDVSDETTAAPDDTESGETSDPGDVEDALELKVYYDAATKTYMESLIEQFRKKHPEVKIITQDFSDIYVSDYIPRLTSELISGGGPDIVLFRNCCSTSNSIENLAELINSGIFLNMDELGVNSSGCNEKVLAGGRYRGGQYIVPLDYSLGLLYTTKERMEKYVIPYGDGITLEEFATAIAEFYENNPGMHAFLDIYTPHDIIYKQNGLSLFDYDKGQLKTGKSTTDTLKSLSQVFDDLYPDVYGDKMMDYFFYMNMNDYKDGALGAFGAGDLLFLGDIELRGIYQSLRGINRVYYESVSSGETPLLLPLPRIDGGNSYSPVLDYCLAVPAYTKSRTAAKLFVETAVDFETQFNTASWYGIPVNDSLVGYIKKWYSDPGYHPSEYEFPKWCEFSPSFLKDYFGAIENMNEAVFTDVRTGYILSDLFYGVIKDGKAVSALIPAADSAFKKYINE